MDAGLTALVIGMSFIGRELALGRESADQGRPFPRRR